MATNISSVYSRMISFSSYPPLNLLSQPPQILRPICAISGLLVNPQKSKALNIFIPSSLLPHLQQALPFSWSPRYHSYLGINLTANPNTLYSTYYPAILTHLTNLMSSWSALPLAQMGRITVTKMAILPKIPYLFQTLPIPVPSHFLRILQRPVFSYVWGSTKLCVSRHILYLSKLERGLISPDITKPHI